MSRPTRPVRAAKAPSPLVDGACADCTAYAELLDQGGGVFMLAIRHDDTCPTYTAMQK